MGTHELDVELRKEFIDDCVLGEWFKPTERLLLTIAELPMFR